jgi:curved DNA-binding protein CbpA
MSVAGDNWEQIALLAEGQLAEVAYPRLLLALSRAGRTGVLELHRGPVDKRIFFAAGTPVDCRSNLIHETFGRFLVAVGRLSEEQLGVALQEALARGVPIGEVLLERGTIDAAELYKLLQQCLARKLLDVFTWREGSFRIAEEAADVDSTLKVKVPQLILTGVLKLTPLDEVTRGVRALFAEPLARQHSGPVAAEDLHLPGAAREVLAALQERPLRMDELAIRLPQVPANDLGRVVYALDLLELVAPASRATSRPAARPAAAAAEAPPTPDQAAAVATQPGAVPAALAEGDLERAKNRILEAYLSYRRRDAFELLGVHESATSTDIEEAWLRFAQQHAPWPLAGMVAPDFVEKARALFIAGSEAYNELRDGERRGVLVQRRRQAMAQKQNQPRGNEIKTDLLDPEVQFKKGMELRAAGQDRKALELLQYAADLDAQNPIYRAEAALCRHQALGATEKALEELEEAVRADAHCGLAWYYLGLVQGQAGRRGEAEESLRRATRLMAPDRRPIDALKELSAKKR